MGHRVTLRPVLKYRAFFEVDILIHSRIPLPENDTLRGAG